MSSSRDITRLNSRLNEIWEELRKISRDKNHGEIGMAEYQKRKNELQREASRVSGEMSSLRRKVQLGIIPDCGGAW